MQYFILALIAINLIGFERYIVFSMSEVPYRIQSIVDFISPFGGIVGRLLFGFRMTENFFGYVAGLLFELFVTVMFVAFIL